MKQRILPCFVAVALLAGCETKQSDTKDQLAEAGQDAAAMARDGPRRPNCWRCSGYGGRCRWQCVGYDPKPSWRMSNSRKSRCPACKCGVTRLGMCTAWTNRCCSIPKIRSKARRCRSPEADCRVHWSALWQELGARHGLPRFVGRQKLYSSRSGWRKSGRCRDATSCVSTSANHFVTSV